MIKKSFKQKQDLTIYRKGVKKLKEEYDMKLIADHIKEFDRKIHKFERLAKEHFPKHLEEKESDQDDHYENYIYFDDEYM